MSTRLVVTPEGEFAHTVALRIAGVVQRAVRARGQCSLALAGGNTPRPVYAALTAAEDVPWEAVDFYFGDERCVPPSSPLSNYRMARESLLDAVGASGARVHRMEAELEDRDAAASRYAAVLPDRLDLLLLGMGADGHTASIFPGDPAASESNRLVVAARGPVDGPWRLTITGPVIRSAREVFVLVAGADKAQPVADVLAGNDPMEAPARLALAGTWFLDSHASSALDDGPF